jgi:UDP-N-acetylglucosamine 2-epimerase (non-hydrolysing)
LVAAKLHIPVAHVEAGVRSFDRSMPEEINRVVTDALADLLFTPSREADANLAHEGIAPEKIHFVGNVMVDTLLDAVELAAQRRTWLKWNFKPHEYAVLTLHRASNVDEINTISEIMSVLSQVTTYLPILFPIHPRTSKRLVEANLDNKVQSIPGLILSEPLGYLDFLCLLSQAKMVLTDSGGIQAETTMLDIPCLTLRWNTEWGVTIAQGTNVLVGTDHDRIIEEAKRILEGHGKQGSRPELWDGNTAQRITTILTRL